MSSGELRGGALVGRRLLGVGPDRQGRRRHTEPQAGETGGCWQRGRASQCTLAKLVLGYVVTASTPGPTQGDSPRLWSPPPRLSWAPRAEATEHHTRPHACPVMRDHGTQQSPYPEGWAPTLWAILTLLERLWNPPSSSSPTLLGRCPPSLCHLSWLVLCPPRCGQTSPSWSRWV